MISSELDMIWTDVNRDHSAAEEEDTFYSLWTIMQINAEMRATPFLRFVMPLLHDCNRPNNTEKGVSQSTSRSGPEY